MRMEGREESENVEDRRGMRFPGGGRGAGIGCFGLLAVLVISLLTGADPNKLLGLIGLTVVVCLRTLGVILVTALLVIPASAGRQVAQRVPTMMLAAVAVSCTSAVAGLLVSYHFSIGSGASIVLCASTCFVVSLGIGRRRAPATASATVAAQ